MTRCRLAGTRQARWCCSPERYRILFDMRQVASYDAGISKSCQLFRRGGTEMYKIFIVTMALIVAIAPFAMIYWAMKNQRPKRRSYYVNRYDIGGTDGGGSGGGFFTSDGWSDAGNDGFSSGDGSFGGGGASGGWGDFGGDSGGGDSGGGGDGGGD